MHAASPTIEPKDFALIGKLYARENPSHALQLVATFQAAEARALDSDLHNLNYYYFLFCKIRGLNPPAYLGSLHTAEKTDVRRLFVGTMIRVYMPQLLTHNIRQRKGFSEALCVVLCQDDGNLSKVIDECVAWMKTNYEDFMTNVQAAADTLVGQKSMAAALSDAA